MPLQFRRGTETDRTSITPAVGEPIWTTDTKLLYVGDGTTAGGVAVGGGGGGASTITNQLLFTTSSVTFANLTISNTATLANLTLNSNFVRLGSSASGGGNSVAIGSNVSADSSGGVSIGLQAQSGPYAASMGWQANAQGSNSIAIGVGSRSNGVYGISIGHLAKAAIDSSIVINASGSEISAATTGTYLAPLTASTSSFVMYYNTSTKEVTYGVAASGGGQNLTTTTDSGLVISALDVISTVIPQYRTKESSYSSNMFIGNNNYFTNTSSNGANIIIGEGAGRLPGGVGGGSPDINNHGNTLVGFLAAGNTTLKNERNTIIGAYAGQLLGSQEGDEEPWYNTYLGYGAGSDIKTGSFNIVIGAEAGRNSLTTSSGNTIIGYNLTLPSGSSNTLVLGAGNNDPMIRVNNSGVFVNYVRGDAANSKVLYYDSSTKEITSGPAGNPFNQTLNTTSTVRFNEILIGTQTDSIYVLNEVLTIQGGGDATGIRLNAGGSEILLDAGNGVRVGSLNNETAVNIYSPILKPIYNGYSQLGSTSSNWQNLYLTSTSTVFFGTETFAVSGGDLYINGSEFVAGNPFNQNLDTTDSVTFANIGITNTATVGALKWSSGITLNENPVKAYSSTNLSIGNGSLGSEPGSGNTVIGPNAASSLTGGSWNTLIGYAVAPSLATSGDSTLIGVSAGYNLTSGDDNIIIGRSGGFQLQSGSRNIIIGNPGVPSTMSDTVVMGSNGTERIKVDSSGLRINGVAQQNVNSTASVTFANLTVGQSSIHSAKMLNQTGTFTLDSWTVGDYQGVKYIININDGSNLHLVEILAGTIGGNTYKTEYAVVTSNGEMASFDTDIDSGNFRLRATNLNVGSIDLSYVRISVTD
jgi:hypothetical protein